MMFSFKDDQYKCTLSSETLEKAKQELNEDPSTRAFEVKTLRKRLEKVPGLKARTDFPFLLAFLRARKFDQERAFSLIKNHYQMRTTDWFMDMKPARVKHLLGNGYIEVLKDRNTNGCKVYLVRVGRLDATYPIMENIKAMYMVFMHLSMDEETQVNGIHMIVDFQDTKWDHYTAFTPGIAKFLFSIIHDVIPLRLRYLDYTHEPGFFDKFFTVIRPVIPEKIKERIHFNGDTFAHLHAVLSPDHLPTDIGGCQPENKNKEWLESFLASDRYFEEDNKHGFLNMTVKSEKKDRREIDAGIQGLGGTFTKLEV